MEPLNSAGWLLQVIQDSRVDATAELWRILLRGVEAILGKAQLLRAVEIEYAPELAADDVDKQLGVLTNLLAHIEAGGAINGFVFRILHGSWDRFLHTVRVNGHRPKDKQDLLALIGKAQLEKLRQDFSMRWKRQVTALGGPDPERYGTQFESVLLQYADAIQGCLEWQPKRWTPLVESMENAGLNWAKCLASAAPVEEVHGDLLRLGRALKECVLPEIEAALRVHRMASAESILSNTADAISQNGGTAVARQLLTALRAKRVEDYRRGWERLRQLYNQRAVLDRRRELLGRMHEVARGWALAISNRAGVHGQPEVPGDARSAWKWRQFTDDLDYRAKRSFAVIQAQIRSSTINAERATATFIESAAWIGQSERLSRRPDADQALRQWVQAVSRATGTGRQAIRLRMSIPRLMTRCREAVPVWIMQLSRVVESCDPSQTRFDLAVIDEASQASLMGLIPMYLADKVIVVGDDEQVSPDAVGEDTSEIQSLVETYLHDLPDRNLFDPTYSLYNFATARFGNPILLREHFRCAPEIIQFSNALSYRFEIQPLRDVSRCRTIPHVIAHKVQGTRGAGKQNEVEAEEIASLVAAMCSLPGYQKASIGIISLVGDEQARLIDSFLRHRISAKEYDDRRIVCGNAYQFQGDERDIMLLSVVDSPADGPLRLLVGGPRDMYKKRYNVAASRARDQMWIVHSLDLETDLKPGDLRLRLLSHALNPAELMKRLDQSNNRVESEFERRVAALLIGRQYAVTPQWKVGAYRIDLVVEGNGRRLAVECDGDRYHPIEQLEDDMRRQEILERLGWTFVRIRGGEFFRHPDRAMEPVFEKLAELEITPTMGVSAPQPEDMRLRDEVIRRATEYRREWSKPAEIPLPRSDQEADEHASQPSRRERSRIHSLHTSKHRLYRPAMVARRLNKNLYDWLAMG